MVWVSGHLWEGESTCVTSCPCNTVTLTMGRWKRWKIKTQPSQRFPLSSQNLVPTFPIMQSTHWQFGRRFRCGLMIWSGATSRRCSSVHWSTLEDEMLDFFLFFFYTQTFFSHSHRDLTTFHRRGVGPDGGGPRRWGQTDPVSDRWTDWKKRVRMVLPDAFFRSSCFLLSAKYPLS